MDRSSHLALVSSPPAEAPARPLPAGGSGSDTFWRRRVLARLEALRAGLLTVRGEAGGALVFGRPAEDGLVARITVHRPAFWRRLALGGSVGAAESYADGEWDAEDLTAVVRLLVRNQRALQGLDAGLTRLRGAVERAGDLLRRNTRAGSRRNIAEHYDLGNAFFALMLDPTMTYSAGVFEREGATLEEASVAKLDRLCRALQLRPGHHLLEIGTGWGSMALHAARTYGCRVTTTTISRRQHELASARVRDAGLQDRVEVLLRDYRDLDGRYDRLVSVEMIEAIGAEYYGTFFATVERLLKEDGLAAIQAITLPDQEFERARREVDFIKRHVFPGSDIPSVQALLDAAARASDLRLRRLEDIGLHYARTLAAWRENLRANHAAVARLTTERFRRLWHFYLCYCEGGFAERYLGDVQLLFARPGHRGET